MTSPAYDQSQNLQRDAGAPDQMSVDERIQALKLVIELNEDLAIPDTAFVDKIMGAQRNPEDRKRWMDRLENLQTAQEQLIGQFAGQQARDLRLEDLAQFDQNFIPGVMHDEQQRGGLLANLVSETHTLLTAQCKRSDRAIDPPDTLSRTVRHACLLSERENIALFETLRQHLEVADVVEFEETLMPKQDLTQGAAGGFVMGTGASMVRHSDQGVGKQLGNETETHTQIVKAKVLVSLEEANEIVVARDFTGMEVLSLITACETPIPLPIAVTVERDRQGEAIAIQRVDRAVAATRKTFDTLFDAGVEVEKVGAILRGCGLAGMVVLEALPSAYDENQLQKTALESDLVLHAESQPMRQEAQLVHEFLEYFGIPYIEAADQALNYTQRKMELERRFSDRDDQYLTEIKKLLTERDDFAARIVAEMIAKAHKKIGAHSAQESLSVILDRARDMEGTSGGRPDIEMFIDGVEDIDFEDEARER